MAAHSPRDLSNPVVVPLPPGGVAALPVPLARPGCMPHEPSGVSDTVGAPVRAVGLDGIRVAQPEMTRAASSRASTVTSPQTTLVQTGVCEGSRCDGPTCATGVSGAAGATLTRGVKVVAPVVIPTIDLDAEDVSFGCPAGPKVDVDVVRSPAAAPHFSRFSRRRRRRKIPDDEVIDVDASSGDDAGRGEGEHGGKAGVEEVITFVSKEQLRLCEEKPVKLGNVFGSDTDGSPCSVLPDPSTKKRPRSPGFVSEQCIQERLQAWDGKFSDAEYSDGEGEEKDAVEEIAETNLVNDAAKEWYSVKAEFQSGLHRLSIPADMQFGSFKQRLRQVFHVEHEFYVEYRDNKNAFVSLACDADMSQLFAMARRCSLNPLRVRLHCSK